MGIHSSGARKEYRCLCDSLFRSMGLFKGSLIISKPTFHFHLQFLLPAIIGHSTQFIQPPLSTAFLRFILVQHPPAITTKANSNSVSNMREKIHVKYSCGCTGRYLGQKRCDRAIDNEELLERGVSTSHPRFTANFLICRYRESINYHRIGRKCSNCKKRGSGEGSGGSGTNDKLDTDNESIASDKSDVTVIDGPAN